VRVHGIRQVELAVELAAAGASRRLLLVARVHHQLTVDGLHGQVARLELGSDVDGDAKYLPSNRDKNVIYIIIGL